MEWRLEEKIFLKFLFFHKIINGKWISIVKDINGNILKQKTYYKR